MGSLSKYGQIGHKKTIKNIITQLDSPTTFIKASIEDTSKVYRLTFKTPVQLRDLFVEIAAKYQWTMKLKNLSNVSGDKTNTTNLTRLRT